jgi:hypothetical protein
MFVYWQVESETYANLGDGVAEDRTRTDIDAIDAILDDTMRTFKAFACNTYVCPI